MAVQECQADYEREFVRLAIGEGKHKKPPFQAAIFSF
jgi:hypothetical protein